MIHLQKLPQPVTHKPYYEFTVDGWFGRYMRRHGWGAFTLPLPLVTIILYWTLEPSEQPDPYSRVHELVHHLQTQHNFFLVSWCRYLVDLAVHGYRGNRYELEAYATEAMVQEDGLPAWASPTALKALLEDAPHDPNAN